MADAMKNPRPAPGRHGRCKSVDVPPDGDRTAQGPISGDVIPLHFIQRVIATHNGKTVMDAQWSQAVSKILSSIFGYAVPSLATRSR